MWQQSYCEGPGRQVHTTRVATRHPKNTAFAQTHRQTNAPTTVIPASFPLSFPIPTVIPAHAGTQNQQRHAVYDPVTPAKPPSSPSRSATTSPRSPTVTQPVIPANAGTQRASAQRWSCTRISSFSSNPSRMCRPASRNVRLDKGGTRRSSTRCANVPFAKPKHPKAGRGKRSDPQGVPARR